MNQRILSLDVFRGMIMVLMVIVNSQGPSAYPILEHAQWNGCTLADLVFPAFLFIVGMTTVISLKKHQRGSDHLALYKSIFFRSGLLFLFGLFLNSFPYQFDLSNLRIYGVLQRIALCYFVCAIIYLITTLRTQCVIFVGILIAYWYLLLHVPVPGGEEEPLAMSSNWVSYFEKQITHAKILYKDFDPEGFLSTLPAIATTLSGLLVGSLLLSSWNSKKKCFMMFGLALSSLLIGWFWHFNFPINKNLWTSTFVLWTSGISLMGFALCYYFIDILGYSRWSIPFKIFGVNALFIFLFHVILLKLQTKFLFQRSNGAFESIRDIIRNYLFVGFSPENASLLYSLLFFLINFLVALYLYRKKIFFKL